MTERNDETVRRMLEDRIRLEAQLLTQRTDCERIKMELKSKSRQDTMRSWQDTKTQKSVVI